MNNIILASTSPYRKEQLLRLGVEFECIAPLVDESLVKKENLSPLLTAQKLALLKAEAVAKKNPNAIVIGSDQLAHINGHILDKPENHQNAINQLQKLKNQEHELITAVAIITPWGQETFTNIAKLSMKDLTLDQIEYYLQNDRPYQCAGSYMLEKMGIGLFSSITTSDYTAIIGLPLIELANQLAKFKISIPPNTSPKKGRT